MRANKPNNRYPGRRHESGVGIVEIMVALVVSLLLLAGVLHLFVSSRATYDMQEQLARVQETGRFAIHFLTRDLREAGFMGCLRLDAETAPQVIVDPPGNLHESFIPESVLNGTEGQVDGIPRDTVTVSRMSTDSAEVVEQNHQGNSPNFKASNHPRFRFKQNDILMVTDCKHAHIFQVTDEPQNWGADHVTVTYGANHNLPPPQYNMHYDPGSEVGQFERYEYAIDENPADIPALYKRSYDHDGNIDASHELVEGVEGMRLLYGEDTDNNNTPNRYLTASNVSDWSAIVAIRVHLLVRSVDEVMTEESPFLFVGSLYNDKGDRHLRREFTTTVSVRNRLRDSTGWE